MLEVSERFFSLAEAVGHERAVERRDKAAFGGMLQTLQDRSRLVLPAVFGIGLAERAEADGAVAQLDATLDFTKALVLASHGPVEKPETQVRERKRRVELQRVVQLGNCLLVVTRQRKRVAEMDVDDERQRIEFGRAAHRRQHVVEPPHRQQIPAVPLMAAGVAGIQAERGLKFPLGRCPVTIVEERGVAE